MLKVPVLDSYSEMSMWCRLLYVGLLVWLKRPCYKLVIILCMVSNEVVDLFEVLYSREVLNHIFLVEHRE